MDSNTQSPILQKINELEAKRTNWNVTEQNMNLMLNYCRQNDLHKILEVGSFNGYSAINFALICEEVISLEIDEERFKEATQNCSVSPKIKVIHADAREWMQQKANQLTSNQNNQDNTFDAILIDGNNSQYKDYLTLAVPLLRDTGMIFIDNTISHKDRLEKKGFFEALKQSNLSHKELQTTKGMIVAFKTQKFYRAQKQHSSNQTVTGESSCQ